MKAKKKKREKAEGSGTVQRWFAVYEDFMLLSEVLWVTVRDHTLLIDWGDKEYNFDAPTDLLHLTCSLCADLVPVGVWVDRFEELHPKQTEVIEFLRKWEEVHRAK